MKAKLKIIKIDERLLKHMRVKKPYAVVKIDPNYPFIEEVIKQFDTLEEAKQFCKEYRLII